MHEAKSPRLTPNWNAVQTSFPQIYIPSVWIVWQGYKSASIVLITRILKQKQWYQNNCYWRVSTYFEKKKHWKAWILEFVHFSGCDLRLDVITVTKTQFKVYSSLFLFFCCMKFKAEFLCPYISLFVLSWRLKIGTRSCSPELEK